MIGKNELEFIEDKALAKTVIENDKRVMETGEPVVIEEDVRLKDGEHTFHSKKVPWMDSKGSVIGLFGISRDITARKAAEEKRRESEAHALLLVRELEEADISKNNFLSAHSHELRNTLAAISAGVQLLDMTDDEEHTIMAKQIIRRQTEQLCRLLDDILDLTKIEYKKIELKRKLSVSVNLSFRQRMTICRCLKGKG